MLDFNGQTVLVVGGSSGIGNAMAQAFRARGATVHVCGRRQQASDYADEDGSNLEGLHYHCLDVTDLEAISRLDPGCRELDVLVLCQGAVLYRRQEFEMPGWQHVMDVNLNSLMACATHFRPQLAAAGGSLIIVSSTAAFHATRGNPAYGASKAGAVALTRNLAEAWVGDGIRVNGIAPGFVETKMTRVTTENPKRRQAALQRIPMGRFGEPAEIAQVALFLASPMASYVCGHVVVVDGGITLS